MSIAYIRKTYGLSLKIGDLVTIKKGTGSRLDGLTGKLVSARHARLYVKGKTWNGLFHPLDVELAQTAKATAKP